MTERTCKHCGEVPETVGVGLGNQCRICKNGLYRYGMTRTDMIALHEAQNGRCVICNTEVELFNGTNGAVIDHCHGSGNVRSILCHPCNIAVGRLETHPDIGKLLEYIEYKV